uniref:Uncharacterized protein n=1 Tax=Caenorhabditis japonica TaxID=281687 RepID=A0A8R1DPB0_CAEJA
MNHLASTPLPGFAAQCASETQMITRTAFLFRSNVCVNDCIAVATLVLTYLIPSSIFRLLVFSFRLLSPVFYLSLSAFRFTVSGFRLPTSVSRLPSSVFRFPPIIF